MSGARGPRPCWRIESSSVRVRSVAPRRRVRAAIACLELGVRPVVAATSQQAEDAVLAAADAAEDVHAAIFFDERGLTELLLRRRVCSASPLLLGARRAGEAAVGRVSVLEIQTSPEPVLHSRAEFAVLQHERFITPRGHDRQPGRRLKSTKSERFSESNMPNGQKYPR